MAHTDTILFSPYLQSSRADLSGLSRHKQLEFLKGKFHRLSGAIDFHLSVHREKVCVDINQILAVIISPHPVPLHLNLPISF